MSASEKQKVVDRAIADLESAETLDQIERIVKRGYEAARGSNSRKEALWAAEKTAKARLAKASEITDALIECLYCGGLVPEREQVPQVDDDDEWSRLAQDHSSECEWIITRSHRLTLPS